MDTSVDDAIDLIAQGKVEKAARLLAAANNKHKRRIVRKTIAALASLGDEDWVHVDRWLEKQSHIQRRKGSYSEAQIVYHQERG